jgi:DNA-binding transcriptional MerR regulator
MEPCIANTAEVNFAIGDVAKMCDVPAHTIRFWEREFGEYLSPVRTPGKQRRYSDGDINQIMRIKKLLWTDRFSIQGAKRMMGTTQAIAFPGSDPVSVSDPQGLALSIAKFIQEQLTKSQAVRFENNPRIVA